MITPTAEVVTALRLKHTPSPLVMRLQPTEPVSQTLSVSEEEVMVALKAFYSSSDGEVDGLGPGHLKDLVASQTAEAGRCLLKAIVNLCSNLLLGQIAQHACGLLFAAYLTALRKKDGDIPQIAIGTVFRRLYSNIAAKRVITELRRQLPPIQLGVVVVSSSHQSPSRLLTLPAFSSDALPSKYRKLELTLLQNLLPQHLLLG